MKKRWVGAMPLFLIAAALMGGAGGAGAQETVAGYPAAEALRLGEAMYQKGILPSGKPMRGVVQGDLEVDGTMTTCANCHMRSGLGSVEGGVLTPPTSGAKLYAPLTGQRDLPGPNMSRSMFQNPPRPAYTDASLANALRHGVDPTGRKFAATMPRYVLDDQSMQILLYYLKQLSSTLSPGVTEKEIRFATVVSDTVKAQEWEAMYLPLTAFLEKDWNDRLPAMSSQWNSRWFGSGVGKPGPSRYRQATLEVWRLKGKPESWGAQLEELYRQKPVFAVLGGMVGGGWGEVHRFCEEHRVPCLFPLTDLPVVSDQDLYTLYFSKGYYQEGEAAAKYLSRVFELPAGKEVIQLRWDTAEGEALAAGFTDSWKTLGSAPLTELRLPAGAPVGAPFWEELGRKHPNAVLLLWLPPEELAGIERLVGQGRGTTLFVSSTMLGGVYAALPDAVRDYTFMTWPRRLPGEGQYTRELVTGWMNMKKVPLTDLETSSKAYFITRILATALADMGADFHRDFFLDLVDMTADQPNSSLSYPKLTFGPGQRYASKGCYIVRLGKGEKPELLRQSDWVIY